MNHNTPRSLGRCLAVLCLAATGGALAAAPVPAAVPLMGMQAAGGDRLPLPAQVQAFGTAPRAGLSLQQAVEAAVAWHPSVRNAVATLNGSGEDIRAARAGYLPQVSAGVGSQLRNRNVTGYDSRRVHQFTVSASQMLYDFGQVRSTVDQARAGQDAAQARVLLAVDQLAQETAHAWIEVRRHEQLLELARMQQGGVTGIADLVRRRRQLGASPQSDALQARAREEAAQANTLDVEALLQRWQQQLRQLAGLSALPGTAGEAGSVLQGTCDLRAETLPLPEVLVAQADLRAAQAERDNAVARTRPTISLDGSFSRGLDEDSYLDNRANDATLMLNVSAPLYEGGGNQARKRAAGHALTAAEAALEHVRLQATQALLDAQTQARGYAAREQVLGGRIDSIEQTRDLYRQQYLDLGTRSLLDLLNSEQEFHQARVEAVNNHHDLLRMQVDCLAANGGLRRAFDLEGRDVAGVELLP